MTGVRQTTTSVGIVGKSPPEAVLQRTAAKVFHSVPIEERTALVELIHWGYGAGGGILFGALPRHIRRRPWVGPAYGFLFWTLFEVAIAPLLGIAERHDGVRERLALLGDHVLYGTVVADSPWLHAD
jgi:hypothetical protein